MADLYEGAYHRANPEASIEQIRDRLTDFTILPVTDATCLLSAETRALLRRRGKRTPDLDLLIGATALEHGLTIVTQNVSDFDGIPDLRVVSP